MRISDLEGKRVALWGFGAEGKAAHAALRKRFPAQPLTLFAPVADHAEAISLNDPLLELRDAPSAEDLSGFDAVIKSPGISPYRAPADAAIAQGARFTSGTALWFAERLPGIKMCVTGTKGKSTTAALIAHLLRSRGLSVGLVGNIGMPLLEMIAPPLAPALWVIELSSYQTRDAREPDLAVVLNLYPEHLDWHGSEARYFDDKLALITRASPRRSLLNWQDPRLRELGESMPETRWFGREDVWHLRNDSVFKAERCVLSKLPVSLPGRHNALNLCAALAAIDAVGVDAHPLAVGAARYQPLPHRLQSLGQRAGIHYIDDSIATTPHASIAALECLRGRRVAIIVGGFDRGLDWQVFADYLQSNPLEAVVCMGQNGARIHALLKASALPNQTTLLHADDMASAVAQAQATVGADGVVLLSPGAPSFSSYANYAARGRHFAKLAGFAEKRSQIQGLGVA